jgi:hypothetical protein
MAEISLLSSSARFHAGDDDTATVVAAHDIHCDSHERIVFSF